MSLESLRKKYGAKPSKAPEPPKGKSVSDAIGGKVGNLQAMLATLKQAPRGKESLVLQTLFGLDPAKADEIVGLLVQEPDGSEKGASGILRIESTENTQGNGQKEGRAGVRGDNPRKIPQKILSLLDCLTDENIEQVARVYVDGLNAVHRVWITDETKKRGGYWLEEPDWKTRTKCADMIAAYREGLPMQRQIQITAAMETSEETLARLRESPAAMEAIAGLRAAGVKIAIGDEVIDVEAMTECVQKSG